MQFRTQSLFFLALVALVSSGTCAVDTALAQADWFDNAWPYRVKVSVEVGELDGSSTLLDFPMLFDADVLALPMQRSRADGGDLVVTKRDGTTVLGHEIVRYDPSAPAAEIWVKADSLSASIREFYVYYGNATAAPQPAAGAAWNSDYVAVYHFDEDPGQGVLGDATAAGNDARANQSGSNWTSSDVAAGQIGQGWDFNGTTHYINTNKVRTQDASFTISAWLKHADRSTDFFFQSNPGFWQLASQSSNASNHPQYRFSDTQMRYNPFTIPLGEFHHFAFVFDETMTIVRFYYDGVLQNSHSFWSEDPQYTAENYYAGYLINPDGSDLTGILGPMFQNPLDLMTGVGDEFRVSEQPLSAEWLATEVANQGAPSSFFAVGLEESTTPTDRSTMGSVKGAYR